MVRPLVFFVSILVLSSAILVPLGVQAQSLTPEERAVLEAQYAALQKEIADQQEIIKQTQAKKDSLQGDVTTLNAQIKSAQATINAKNILIKQLGVQIATKNATIQKLTERIDRGKASLAVILKNESQLDDTSVVVVALSNQNVSDFFADLDAYVALKKELQMLFEDIRSAKAQTETEKAILAEKQDQTADARYEAELQKKQIDANKVEKQQLLAITKNQEVEYQKVLAERQAKAAAIRAALFPLRDAEAIPFETALRFAKDAERKTGVRSALILAILTQESNLGKNVGQCYVTNLTTGAGIKKNTETPVARVMKPERDIPPFVDLGTRLGFDPVKQVVSCPQAVGYGGAMGPAQFIPSTWKIYEQKVAEVTGHPVPNPWAAGDAIAAMSVYLGELGADVGGYTAESRAAGKYYAGGAWATLGRAYSKSVMALAESIQKNIDFLSAS
jgi:membrane-bound lytic murein transglycosylase B